MLRPSPPSRKFNRIFNLLDLEAAAKKHLPPVLFSYIANASEENGALDDNRKAFAEWGFLPRVMIDVSKRSQEKTLFGIKYDAPFGIAPMGISAMMSFEGDLALTKAAKSANIPMIMSGSSLIKLEEIVAANENAWFQAYLPGDSDKIFGLLERVKVSGFKTLVVTVDTNQISNRDNMLKNGFSTPFKPSLRLFLQGLTHPSWLLNTFFKTLLKRGMPHFENSFAYRGAPAISKNVLRDFAAKDHLNWQHLREIRAFWKGKMVVKGIMTKEDALIAKECGADGIILSNHGGRQLDYTLSPLRVLKEVKAVMGSTPVMLDSGIRRGTDVMKALALGADFVFVGRPMLYAAALGEADGVKYTVDILKHENHLNMALLGVNSIAELNESYLRKL